uniref:Tripartite motif-containing protein 16-like n=1 Tax=Periophthalmus magnuspinnatus TaxID=409849 RepID=A0A3B4AKI3_9GOBI
MAERELQLDHETFSCCICLDLLKDPVTIPCGHSYCMSCVNTHWNGEVGKQSYSCPQCRQNFTWRPVLMKNTLLAALVEELSRCALPAAPVAHCSAAHGDVSCDLCSVRKVKAVKSCLQCLVSYCKEHLQPHYDVAALKKHRLVEPTDLQDNVCSLHDEVMKMFCRTDQLCICYLCSVDGHKGHDTVLAVTKRHEMQRELEDSIQKIRQRIQEKQEQVDLLQSQTDDAIRCGNKAVGETDRVFTQIARLMERTRTEVKKHIRAQQEAEERRVKELQDKLQQEITELKRRYNNLERLSHTEDHSGFILTFPSLSKLSEESDFSASETRSFLFLDVVTSAVAELRDKLLDPSALDQAWLTLPEVTSRAELLSYAHSVTLDPNTAHTLLSLSAEDVIVRHMSSQQEHPEHPDRFTDFAQVLTKEALTGRCYLEVKGRCEDYFSVVVASKDIRREGPFDECSFGNNTMSWALDCYSDGYVFWHNKVSTTFTATPSKKIGIFVDYIAGIVSFYSVTQEVALIHTVQTTFTQPLLAGIWLKDVADCAEVCNISHH